MPTSSSFITSFHAGMAALPARLSGEHNVPFMMLQEGAARKPETFPESRPTGIDKRRSAIVF